MKPVLTLIIAAIFAASLLLLFRYDITVQSPIIVKLDRLSGKSWVANSGVWMEIVDEAKK